MLRTPANQLLRSAVSLRPRTPRSTSISAMLRTPTNLSLRSAVRSVARPLPVAARFSSTEAISNPTLANIEKRWEEMPPQEQAELWMALRDRMKNNWKELTLQEQKAAYWIAFGPHGPRAEPPPGEFWRTVKAIIYTFIISGLVLALIRYFARDPPRTMTKEWQEASNKMLIAQRSDPITGISSEGYTGKGMVQSPPAKK